MNIIYPGSYNKIDIDNLTIKLDEIQLTSLNEFFEREKQIKELEKTLDHLRLKVLLEILSQIYIVLKKIHLISYEKIIIP